MSEASSSPKRPRLDYDDSSEKEDRYEKYKTRDRDHDESSFLPSKTRKRSEQDEEEIKEEENKSKNVTMETARREHTLVMRLTSKEQELQDCMNQIQEMKQAQTQNTAQLRSMLLDPAINLVFQRMAKEMDEHREKLKQKQNELSAWKFTPDRMLLAENGELGKMISSGRTARLEGEIVLHKALVTEMKKNQKELDEFLRELDVDVEGMQGMILLLQQQLKDAREQIARLQQENDQLRTLRPPDSEVGEVLKESSPGPAHSWPTNDSSNQDLNTSSPHVVNSVTDMWPDHGTTKCAPVSSPCLSVTSGQNQSDHIISAQNSDADLAVDSFACKVTPDSGMQTQEDEEASLDNLYNKESSSNPTTCLLNDNRTGQQAIADSTKEQDVTDSCMERTDFSNDVLEDSIKIETSEYSCLSEDKTALHTSLGLNILMRGEEDKLDCQTRLSLLNGTSLPGQGL